jgi:hypothetical protein
MLGPIKLDTTASIVALAALLTLIGIICFAITVWSSMTSPFSIKRTAVTLSGGNRTEFSRPLVFAVGAILCLALAAGLLGYRNVGVRQEQTKGSANGNK